MQTETEAGRQIFLDKYLVSMLPTLKADFPSQQLFTVQSTLFCTMLNICDKFFIHEQHFSKILAKTTLTKVLVKMFEQIIVVAFNA